MHSGFSRRDGKPSRYEALLNLDSNRVKATDLNGDGILAISNAACAVGPDGKHSSCASVFGSPNTTILVMPVRSDCSHGVNRFMPASKP